MSEPYTEQQTLPEGAVETVAAPGSSDGEGGDGLRRGQSIARYIVTESIGAGGMGRVYAAYDPDLDRKVAIKVMHSRSTGSSDRLIREAKAMAKLAHPNVLTVHDVGTVADQVWLAMEFIDGQTLAAWLAAEPHPWSDVVEVLLQAGTGLAAAHRAGLVHRDFKPANVLLARDGRVCVADFGLARAAGPPPAVRADTSAAMPGDDVTVTRGIAGTPAYMAPEQHEGHEVGAPADQFAFCVALYEGLYGSRPFAGATLPTLVAAVVSGAIREPPGDRRVPAWLKRVVLRGLQTEPDGRFPSMEALLSALGRDPGRTRRIVLAALGVLGVGGGAGVLLARGPEPCTGAADQLIGTWDEPRRQAIADSFAAFGTDHPYADPVFQSVQIQLDAYAEAWVSMHDDACRAARVRGEQSVELMDLRMTCLERRKKALANVTDVLADADEGVLTNAVATVARLPSISACGDLEQLTARLRPPEDPHVRAEVERIRDELARASILRRAGKIEAATELTDGAFARATPLGYRPLVAEVTYEIGSLHRDQGDEETAEKHFFEALFTGLATGHHELVARTSTSIVSLITQRQHRHAEADRWMRVGEGAIEQLGGTGERRIGLLVAHAWSLRERGNLKAAAKVSGEAVDLARKLRPPGDVALVEPLIIHGMVADGDRSLALIREAATIMESLYGPDHPKVSNAYVILGLQHTSQGDHEQAIADFGRAYGVMSRIYGPDNIGVVDQLSNLAVSELRAGRFADAEPKLDRVLEVYASRYGPNNPDVAECHHNLARLYLAQGRMAEAEQAVRAVLSTYATDLARWPVKRAAAVALLANTRRRLGHANEARTLAEDGLRAATAADLDPLNMHSLILALALAEAETGRADEAVPRIEESLARVEGSAIFAEALDRTRFALAVALWEQGNHDRALELARQTTGDPLVALQAKPWLREREASGSRQPKRDRG